MNRWFSAAMGCFMARTRFEDGGMALTGRLAQSHLALAGPQRTEIDGRDTAPHRPASDVVKALWMGRPAQQNHRELSFLCRAQPSPF